MEAEAESLFGVAGHAEGPPEEPEELQDPDEPVLRQRRRGPNRVPPSPVWLYASGDIDIPERLEDVWAHRPQLEVPNIDLACTGVVGLAILTCDLRTRRDPVASDVADLQAIANRGRPLCSILGYCDYAVMAAYALDGAPWDPTAHVPCPAPPAYRAYLSDRTYEGSSLAEVLRRHGCKASFPFDKMAVIW